MLRLQPEEHALGLAGDVLKTSQRAQFDDPEMSGELQARPRIAFLCTVPVTVRTFFERQLRTIHGRGFEVHIITSPGPEVGGIRERTGLPVHEVAMRRKPRPVADACALVRMYLLVRRLRPDILHTHTPKAGLLGMLAGRALGVKVRIYTLNGLPLVAYGGWRRRVLVSMERISCWAATDVIAVSESLRREAIELGLAAAGKIRVIGRGSSHGVNLRLFDPRAQRPRAEIRRGLGIPAESPVLCYAGRLTRDKGIHELAAAWEQLRESVPEVRLLICDAAAADEMTADVPLRRLKQDPRTVFVSAQFEEMPKMYAAADVCILPTRREGLPNVPLECGAMRVPIVASRVTGCVDAVVDGVTGILVSPRDPGTLASAVEELLRDSDRRLRMGEAARRFVESHYSEDAVDERMAETYATLLRREGWERMQAACGAR